MPTSMPDRLEAIAQPPLGTWPFKTWAFEIRIGTPLVCAPQRSVPPVPGPRSSVATMAVAFLDRHVAHDGGSSY
jgi:hypothetical protein